MSVGQQFEVKPRTGDIVSKEDLTFRDFLLSPRVLEGLESAGFHRPSPIQVKAIPLGRCGFDLIVQAKSGTGKTCVFSVILLEHVSVESNALQALVLSPTREIAVQSQSVIKTIGAAIKGLQCQLFIGGIHLSEDLQFLKNCHIAVGSPGRIKYLIESGYMKTDSIRMLVIDEADLLFTENFQPTINWIYSSLPNNKQVLTLSATYTPNMIQHLTMYMKSPHFVRLNSVDPALLGIKQFFHTVPNDPSPHIVFQSKASVLFNILASVEFEQCLIFSNFHSSAQELCETLTENGWPTAYIAGSLTQADRLLAYDKLKRFHCRVLVSTDLTSRGIDAENVNLVVNMEVPWEHETYLHRIGRAGRYGSYGAAISLVSEGTELKLIGKVQERCNTKIHQLPDPIPADLARSECQINLDDLVTSEKLAPAKSRDSKRFRAPRSALLTPTPLPVTSTVQDHQEAYRPSAPSLPTYIRQQQPSDAATDLTTSEHLNPPPYESPPSLMATKPEPEVSSISHRHHHRHRRSKPAPVNKEVGHLVDQLWTVSSAKPKRDEIFPQTILSQLSTFRQTGESPFSHRAPATTTTTTSSSSTLSHEARVHLIDDINRWTTSLPTTELPPSLASCDSDSSSTQRSSSPSVNIFNLPTHGKEIAIQTDPVEENLTSFNPCHCGNPVVIVDDAELIELRSEYDRVSAWADYFYAQYEHYDNLVVNTEAELAELLQEQDSYQ